MSKKGKQSSPAEDYLAQVNWENENQVDKRGHAPWKNTPKWKYKRAFSGRRGRSMGGETFWWVAVISISGYMIFQILVEHNGKGILISIILLAMLAMAYFMYRESQRK